MICPRCSIGEVVEDTGECALCGFSMQKRVTLGKPAVDASMLVPLLVMTVGFTLYFAAVLLTRTRAEVLDRERNKRWVQEVI